MTTAYSTNLGLALPVQGELSGTWGDTVNNGITQYSDIAIAGTQTISGSQTAVTLSLTNGNAAATNIAQAGTGTTGSAQFAIINCTGNPASLLTITVPASSRQYTVINATSTSQSVKIVGAGPTTGVTIVSGEKATVAWNGSDFVKVASSLVSQLSGTLGVANGGTGLVSFTSGGVMYASSTSALTTGSALTFDGTNFGIGTSSPSAKLNVVGSGDMSGIFESTGTSNAASVIVRSGSGTTSGLYAYARFVNNDTNAQDWRIGTYGTNNLSIVNAKAGTTPVVLDTSGNVGIGTSSPGAKLVVADGSAYITNTAGNSAGVELAGNGNGAASTSLFIGQGSDGTGYVYQRANLSLLFGTNAAEKMRLDASGNLGVGLTPVANNGILQLNSYASVQAMMEKATISATAATGTINFDAATQAVLYYTTNASGNWTINIRGNSGLSLNSMMQTGQSLTLAFMATNGSTAYYQSALTVDGASVTPKWQGGTAPTSGNASAIDAYVLTVIKTGSATFTVLASQTKFA